MKESRYKAKTYVGSGGMASVYKAFDQSLERDVAIKEMAEQLRGNEDVLKLFFNEARKMASVRHINVVQVYDVLERDEVPTIIMEYMGGGSLASRLGPGRLPQEDVIDILQQVVAGLHAIHAAGLVHRDIKPENILEEKGVYKITDFGVAMSDDEDTLPFVTSKYAAPEVLLAPEQIGPKSDLYSLGTMAIELLLGPQRFMEVVKDAIDGEQRAQLPAIKDSVQAFWQQWVASSVELPLLNEFDDAISPEVAELLRQLTKRDPQSRLSDCQALIGKLAELKRHDRQRIQAPTEHDARLKRRLDAKKASAAKAAAKPANSPATKKKTPLWFKAVIGTFAMLLLAVVALLFIPTSPGPAPAFALAVTTDPPGASVAANGVPIADGGVTPLTYDARWGDELVLTSPGRDPLTVVLEEGMQGLSTSEQGVSLLVAWPAEVFIATSADAAAALGERLPRTWPLAASLDGAGETTPATVAVGSPLKFTVESERAGYALLVHLGADNSMSMIYPAPDGSALMLPATTPTPVGTDLGLVANEPLGNEWFLFVVTSEQHVPPAIAGSEIVGGKATRYTLAGSDDSPGRSLVVWLLDSLKDAEAAAAIVPIEVVPERGP
jgi:serine/threonine protein kinase